MEEKDQEKKKNGIVRGQEMEEKKGRLGSCPFPLLLY